MRKIFGFLKQRLSIVVIVICFGLNVSAQTPPDTSPPALTNPATLAPNTPPGLLSTTTPDNTPYLNNPALLASCQARVADFQGKPCGVIFIGDSTTADWLSTGKALWDKLYVPRHALNFGVDGDRTENVLWRLSNMNIQELAPKVAVILIGMNNSANDPHEIAAGVEAVVANTEEIFPGVKIILVSIPPDVRAGDKMLQANAIIKGLADNSTTFYLDLVPLFSPGTPSDGKSDKSWKGLTENGLKLDATGYEIWANAMEPLMTKLMGNK
jgi:lysophospholipase L1-like esterase